MKALSVYWHCDHRGCKEWLPLHNTHMVVKDSESMLSFPTATSDQSMCL
jgi:hypothetical protein